MTSRIFGNGTDIVHWEASPQSRGTWDILSSCIITLILCVWTAVHLSISPLANFWEPKLRKVGWLVLALLAPEMVAYTAWYVEHGPVFDAGRIKKSPAYQRLILFRYQGQEACIIMRKVNAAFNLPNPRSNHEAIATVIREIATKLGRLVTRIKEKPLRVRPFICLSTLKFYANLLEATDS